MYTVPCLGVWGVLSNWAALWWGGGEGEGHTEDFIGGPLHRDQGPIPWVLYTGFFTHGSFKDGSFIQGPLNRVLYIRSFTQSALHRIHYTESFTQFKLTNKIREGYN